MTETCGARLAEDVTCDLPPDSHEWHKQAETNDEWCDAPETCPGGDRCRLPTHWLDPVGTRCLHATENPQGDELRQEIAKVLHVWDAADVGRLDAVMAVIAPHLVTLPAPLPAPPTEDDTERVERMVWALYRYSYGDEPMPPEQRPTYEGLARAALAALPPAQPDPATVERARAEGREQGLRAFHAYAVSHGDEHTYDGCKMCEAGLRALSSATPSAPEGTGDRG